MDSRLEKCLEGKWDTSHILPFFWQHGEDKETLLAEMEAMKASGLTQFCVECRPFDGFCEEPWWDTFGYILEYAKRNGMKVWLLDDKHFPTGYACGYLNTHPELRQVTLTRKYYDFVGGLGKNLYEAPELNDGERFVKILAYRRTEDGQRLTGDAMDLTDTLKDGFITADFPAGVYRVFYLIRSQDRHVKKEYIDMLNPDSTQAMITAVYEPHYRHFKEYFGNTLIGFFSDEPGFANDKPEYYSYLKNEMQTLPWRDDLPEKIAAECSLTSGEVYAALPALWQEVNAVTPELRHAYMDAVTKLYSKCFCEKLGDWCRAHGVMYIGHIIEDMGAHLRLTYSSGHFFRALDGQDMGGCDIVLNQMIPGLLEMKHAAAISGETGDPEFFSYLLAKLASSHGHIDARKRGRSMCEVFGAFGWAEGLPMMKYIADHMLVSGINYYVPHAFSPKQNDPDCPPHFYNHGTNGQFLLFGELMDYMHRLSWLFSDGMHVADVAVLYSTAEWFGHDAFRRTEVKQVTKTLTQHQIDFDVLPFDYLKDCTVKEHCLLCNGESYRALVVPGSECIHDSLLQVLNAFAAQGLPVIFAGKPPVCTPTRTKIAPELPAVPLGRLAAVLRGSGFAHLRLSRHYPHLRFYHYVSEGCDRYMFFNDDPLQTEDFTFITDEDYVLYRPMENRVFAPGRRRGGWRVKLEPFEAVCLVKGESAAYEVWDYGEGGTRLPVALTEEPCGDGNKQYTAVLPKTDGKAVLEMERVGELAVVSVNGKTAAKLIAAPYRADLSGLLTEKENRVDIRVIPSEAYRHADRFSAYLPVVPAGIGGAVSLRVKK